MVVKFEQTRMVQAARNFELLTKNLFCFKLFLTQR